MASSYLSPTLPVELPANPMAWAKAWLDEAVNRSVQRNPNAMTIATVDSAGQPSARVVLCKEFAADPGYLVFYTNYLSRKAEDLEQNPATAACFHWDSLGRQIRLEGMAVLSPADESDTYFATRHWGSQIGAWGSDQSRPVDSRQALISQVGERARKLGVPVADDLQSLHGDAPQIPRPAHWGGIRLWPHTVELWIEGDDRIHDRARWTRTIEPSGEYDFVVGAWTGIRIQP